LGKAMPVVKLPKNAVCKRHYNNFFDKIAMKRTHGVNTAYEGCTIPESFGALRVVNNLLITFFVETCKKT